MYTSNPSSYMNQSTAKTKTYKVHSEKTQVNLDIPQSDQSLCCAV